MVDEDQSSRLLRFKALLDSGAITQEEFQSAKNEILGEGAISVTSTAKSQGTKYLRLFGALGLLSLAIPWYLEFFSAIEYEYSGGLVSWNLFSYAWYNGDYSFFSGVYHIFMSGDTLSMFYDVLAKTVFVLALAGGSFLLLRKRFGGIVLLVSVIGRVFSIAISFLLGQTGLDATIFPLGVLLSGVVGLVSTLYKK